MTKLGDRQDRYTPDAGEHDPQEKIYCGVCGDLMDARFDANGPRGFVQAMAGSKSLHDVYSCPNTNEDWHTQVVVLRREKSKTASTLVEALLEEEIGMILESREATKKVSLYHAI